MDGAEIDDELRRRSADEQARKRLVVDYYRIRRRLAVPLPVRELPRIAVPVPGSADYPWSVWLAWRLEERLHALGWAGDLCRDRPARVLAREELLALASWPRHRQYDKPDLCLGHCARTLRHALDWRWPDGELRAAISDGLCRMLDEAMPACERIYGRIARVEDVLASEQPHMVLHNIPFIGTIGLALAADAAGRSERDLLHARVEALVRALLVQRAEHGFTEGVAYDGYLLDFIADWLAVLPDERRQALLDDARWEAFLDMSLHLAAPGAQAQVAELSDVEPERMPFHMQAQAKWARWAPTPRRGWYLRRLSPQRLGADALGHLHGIIHGLPALEQDAGPADAGYAVVLRGGWEHADLAVACSVARSPMEHMHRDAGTIVVGSGGRWLLHDPGYQQYLPTSEREFALGAAAHNAPVVDGHAQERRAARLLRLEGDLALQHAAVEIAACYGEQARVRRAERRLWLLDGGCVVVVDILDGGPWESLRYHWHGHPAAAWWVEGGVASIVDDEHELVLQSPQAPCRQEQLQRLRGSRGHLTLVCDVPPATGRVWWLISSGAPPAWAFTDGGAALHIAGRDLRAD